MGNVLKKIAIVGIVGVPAKYGGFETLVENLIDADHEFMVYCSLKSYDGSVVRYKSADLIYLNLDANGVQSMLYDVLATVHALRSGVKNVLMLGVSGAWALPFIKLLYPQVNIVVNIDGLEWRREKWGFVARRVLKFLEWCAVKFSKKVVADNKAIADYVMKEYSVESALIAYGGDHAILGRKVPRSAFVRSYALGLCRIEPENNVHLILQAFAVTGRPLKFVGNWNSSEYGLRLKSEYSEFSNIEILNPIYESDSLYEIRSGCDCYVHGHSAGGTNPSLVEMMFFAKPIFAFECDYNKETLHGYGGFFSSVDQLVELIASDAYGSGEVFFDIAVKNYQWADIRSRYLSLFN